ncbi:MAG: 30S ribosomal protein S16 [Caldilineae bacterium]|nr:MAG: 30S ribosomal protein S16 [Caldilineae bacterium]
MVKIRLRRTGSKKRASFRIVVAPSRAPRDGRFIETLGHYNPRHDPPTVVVNEERLFHWLGTGAQLSDSLKRILESKGVLERYARFKAGETEPAPEAEAETEAEAEAEPATEAETA